MNGRSSMLVLLLLFFLFFSPLWPQLSISAAVLSCSSCHHTSTDPTMKGSCHVTCHPLLRDRDLLSATPDTTTPTHRPSPPEPSWRISETWYLSYTWVQTPLGLYLAQALRQLCCYYVCTILTDCLCCRCFPEPGVVFECSAVSLRFLFLFIPPLLGSYSVWAFNKISHNVWW